jgi:hypothetical protein
MDIDKINIFVEFIIRAHILNPLWYSRERRHTIREDVKSDTLARYFKRYLPTNALPTTTAINDDTNEKIYTIWFQSENDTETKGIDLIKSCWRSARRNCKQEYVILDKNTLFNYIDLPGVIMDKRKNGCISHAHFADICRVELLHNYGGFWMDSTDFVTAPIPQSIVDLDFFMFMAGRNVGSPYSFVQNCFIRSRKGAYLLEAWRTMILEYWKNEPRDRDYFMHQLLFKSLVKNDLQAKQFFAQMPHIDQDPTHALWYKYRDEPFDNELFNKLTADSFFQKLTYRGFNNLKYGSFGDAIVKM